MGKRNQEKRRAKQKDRRKRGPTPPRGSADDFAFGFDDTGGAWEADAPSPTEMLSEAVIEGARAYLHGDASAPERCAADLVRGRHGHKPALIGTGTDLAFQRLIGMLWPAGWLPVDLWQVIRRKLNARAARLMIDAITAEMAQYAQARVHERWSDQLDELESTWWWSAARPHLGQWAEREGLPFEAALSTAITVLGVLLSVPDLPVIVPPPGKATRTGRVRHVDEKVLSRVQALLAKAESSEYPDEAEALSAKAQELMHRHSFERALLDADEHRAQTADSSRVWLEAPYVDAKAHLVDAVAGANRCRAVYDGRYGFTSLVGESLDLEITELLIASLLIQASRAMRAEGSQITQSGTSRTRSFRQSFLVSYATRIGERLREAESAEQQAAEDSRLLPVLADRHAAVEETLDSMFPNLTQKSVSISNGAGWQAGREAADNADLTINRTAVTT